MFIFLSKFLPLFVYPLGLVCVFLVLSLVIRKQSRWARASIIIAIAVLWLGSNRWVAMGLTRTLEWQYFPPDELPVGQVVVVLGGSTDPFQFPRSMVEINSAGDRVLYAGLLYKQGIAERLLLSGGRISWMDSNSTPSEEMAAILLMMGVPEEAFWLETVSQNTYENALYSSRILKREGIDQIVLVTSAMHMPRAVALFKHQGLDVIPAPADYVVTQEDWRKLGDVNLPSLLISLVPSAGNLELTTNALKEYIGIAVYRLRGWL